MDKLVLILEINVDCRTSYVGVLYEYLQITSYLCYYLFASCEYIEEMCK